MEVTEPSTTRHDTEAFLLRERLGGFVAVQVRGEFVRFQEIDRSAEFSRVLEEDMESLMVVSKQCDLGLLVGGAGGGEGGGGRREGGGMLFGDM